MCVGVVSIPDEVDEAVSICREVPRRVVCGGGLSVLSVLQVADDQVQGPGGGIVPGRRQRIVDRRPAHVYVCTPWWLGSVSRVL